MLVAKRETYSYQEDYNIKETIEIKKDNRNYFAMKIKFFAVALIALIICLGVLLRYAQMTQIKMEVTKLDTEIRALEKHKVDISLELERIKESGWIEREASLKLGMMYPTNSQVVYVSVNDSDIEENIKETDETGKLAFLKLFSSPISKISNKF